MSGLSTDGQVVTVHAPATDGERFAARIDALLAVGCPLTVAMRIVASQVLMEREGPDALASRGFKPATVKKYRQVNAFWMSCVRSGTFVPDQF